MAGGRVLFFSAPCGFSKTALAEALLRGQDVLHLSAGDEGFALPPVDGRWRVLLLDDLQNMHDENDWNALCELIHSGADRRFVLLSPWRAAGLSDRLPVQRNGKILPCAAQSNTIKPPVRLSNRRLSSSKKSIKCWAFSDRYGRMGKGDERCWNAGKWIEIW